MDPPNIVPDKISSPVNYKILILIIVSAVVFQYALTGIFTPDDSDVVISIVSLINPLSVSMAGFFLAYHYKGSMVFGKSYLFLGLGFFSLFLGEVTYSIYDLVFGIEPYPSIADIFFFAYIPLLISYLILNIRFFHPSTKNIVKIGVIIIPVMITAVYVALSISEPIELNFDFYYGGIFVAATSIALSLTIFGTILFRGGILGQSWLILLIGILVLTFADDWYYYLEIVGNYDLGHPVNTLWYVGYWIIVYALLKHKKTI